MIADLRLRAGAWAPAVVLAAAAAAALALHAPAAALALVGAAAGWVGAAFAGRRAARLVDEVGALLEPPAGGGPRDPRGMAARLAARLAQAEHRQSGIHPTTRLPTREHLISVVDADVATGAPGLLGLLHFADFDQLLAFDDLSAREGLARLAERVVRAVGDRRLVSQVDRATFAVWLPTPDASEAFAALTYTASQQLALADGPLTPRVGHATAAFPAQGATAEQLLARATAQLTGALPARPRASAGGGLDADRERFVLEQELGRAIEGGQLSMAFQPVVDVASRRLVGAEALLRWTHPVLGAVEPSRFIPVVEWLGLSDRYGLWALDAACREAARWRAGGLGGLRMAVNLSARQVGDPDLEAEIEGALARHGLSADAVELELTETAAMADAERTRELFTRLRARGLGLAADDFGSGYSSLSYLKNLPFTKLKIDREFVAGVDTRRDSRAICKALLELGRGLDLDVLAEGVETAAEVEALSGLGCRLFQGFHISRPLDGDGFLRFARTSAWRVDASGPTPA